ncbi:MAG: hypothetical protein ICV78_10350, partial [Tolypothrix sp. Co-bin9]|nr:hypothetical protein [Tolypothrix sp. Co-bin9]
HQSKIPLDERPYYLVTSVYAFSVFIYLYIVWFFHADLLNTVIQWVKEAAKSLPDPPQNLEIPEVPQVDELGTFVGKKIWIWTAVNKSFP